MRMMSENGHEKDFPEIQFVHLIVSNNNIEFALLKKSLHFGIDLQVFYLFIYLYLFHCTCFFFFFFF